MSKLQYLTSLKGPVMASCVSRLKSEEFKKYVNLSGYLAGRKVDFEVPDPVEIQTDIKTDTAPDYMAVEGVSIVSDKLKSLIERFEVPNVEFFRAEVELFNKKVSLSRPKIYLRAYPPGDVGGGKVLTNYWWMNIWNKVDVIDRDKSIGAWMPGLDAITGRSFPNEDIPDYFVPEDGRQRIVLREGAREHLFRVVGLRGPIFVSPEFSEAMEQVGVEVAVGDFVMRRGGE
jgi:hypothetical protein